MAKFLLQLMLVLLATTVVCFNLQPHSTANQGIVIYYGRNVNVPFTVQDMFCFENSGYERGTITYNFNTSYNYWYSLTNITNCTAAGLSMDILILPYSDATAGYQVGTLFANIQPAQYGMIWINVDFNSYFRPSCNFLAKLANAIIQKGKTVGIRTTKQIWLALFGSDSCPDLVRFPLWTNATETFGGWPKTTRISLNSTQSICSYAMSVYN